MGYEVRMYVGWVSTYKFDSEDSRYFSPTLTLNLGKIHGTEISNLCSKVNKNEDDFVYFYGSDGETVITEDMYGKRLYALQLKTVLDAIKRDLKAHDYVFLKLAHEILKTLLIRCFLLN